MKHSGLLGFPRLTSLGPLTAREFNFSTTLTRQRADAIVREVSEENDIPPNDISEEQYQTLVEEIADTIYPPEDSNVSEATNERFKNCMNQRWVSAWIEGLVTSENVEVRVNSERDAVAVMAQGCAGMTEANVAASELIIPERFK